VQADWFLSPAHWERYLQTATVLDLEALETRLPNSDAGNYRRVCLAVERGDFEIALLLLEEGGSLFETSNFGAGLHAYVRQRLGLKLKLSGPREGDALGKEDTVYWYLAWTLFHAQEKQWKEAKHWLEEAAPLASKLGMKRTLSLLEMLQHNLSKPFCGLPPVAPPNSVLASPKAFDTLRQNETAFSRLAALKTHGHLDRLERCRLAQYQLYCQHYDEALRLIDEASPNTFLLAYAVRMKILECLERFEDLEYMVEAFKPGSSAGLEAEATVLAYESCAFYFAVVKKEYRAAYAYLHRAEALALEHALTYRLNVIRNHLEVVANMTGDTLALDPLLAQDSLLRVRRVRNRFDSFLRSGDLAGVEMLVDTGDLSKEELFLARATREYARSTVGQGKIHVVAGLVGNQEPAYPVSRFYWSLLLLQVFSHMGAGDGHAKPERIFKTLLRSLNDIDQVDSVLPVAANVYPLGLSLAAHLHPKLAAASQKVATVWCDDKHDGLRREGKKVSIITKPVREAIVLDDLYATRDNLIGVLGTKTGHRENRARFERSLEQVHLERHHITSVGGVYRGLLRLSTTLCDTSLLRESEALRDTSPFLQRQLGTRTPKF
jgi:exonuclease VII small subunit